MPRITLHGNTKIDIIVFYSLIDRFRSHNMAAEYDSRISFAKVINGRKEPCACDTFYCRIPQSTSQKIVELIDSRLRQLHFTNSTAHVQRQYASLLSQIHSGRPSLEQR